MAAQNQHYVPKFILRQFLSNRDKEYVSVYDKENNSQFETSLRNIMAERRFNDFIFDDQIVSFEPAMGRIEDVILPTYRKILECQKLDNSDTERAALSLFMAFQFLRTKAHRSRFENLEAAMREKIEAMGGKMEDVHGWEPLTENLLKKVHIDSISNSVAEFSNAIASKVFFLAQSHVNSKFYIGDNPVVMHNNNDYGPYGNMGLSVPGIQVYMPLSSELMLCAFCPSIIKEMKEGVESIKLRLQKEALALAMRGGIAPAHVKISIENALAKSPPRVFLNAVETGCALPSSLENMDFYNSLQTGAASRFIVCQKSNFHLARRVVKENPDIRSGLKMKFN